MKPVGECTEGLQEGGRAGFHRASNRPDIQTGLDATDEL